MKFKRVWVPLALAVVICGMPEHVIRKWAKDGKVRAKKLDEDSKAARMVYWVPDLLEVS